MNIVGVGFDSYIRGE